MKEAEEEEEEEEEEEDEEGVSAVSATECAAKEAREGARRTLPRGAQCEQQLATAVPTHRGSARLGEE